MIHLEIAYRLLGTLKGIEDESAYILGSVSPDSVHMDEGYEVHMKVKSHLFEGCGPWGDTRDYGRWLRNIKEFYEEETLNAIKRAGSAEEKSYISYITGVCVHCITDYMNDLHIWRRASRIEVGADPSLWYEDMKAWTYENVTSGEGISVWDRMNALKKDTSDADNRCAPEKNLKAENNPKYIIPKRENPDSPIELFRKGFNKEAFGIDRYLYEISNNTTEIRRLLGNAQLKEYMRLENRVELSNIKKMTDRLLNEQYPEKVSESGSRSGSHTVLPFNGKYIDPDYLDIFIRKTDEFVTEFL